MQMDIGYKQLKWLLKTVRVRWWHIVNNLLNLHLPKFYKYNNLFYLVNITTTIFEFCLMIHFSGVIQG